MTAVQVFAMLVALFPPADDPDEWARYGTVAVAFVDAVDHQMARGWDGSRAQLERSGMTAFRFESRLDRSVHAGTKRGPAGGICLAQIHPNNGLFREYADEFFHLAGTSYGSTLACLQTMFHSLASGRSHCLKRAKQEWSIHWRPAMWRMYASGSACTPTRHSWRRARFQASLVGKEFATERHMVEIVDWARLEAK